MPILVLNTVGSGGGGTVTGADNGLVVNSNIVELGTNPLNQDTEIFGADFNLTIASRLAADASRSNRLIVAPTTTHLESFHAISVTSQPTAGLTTFFDTSGGDPVAVFARDNLNPSTGAHTYQGFITKTPTIGVHKGILCIDSIDQVGEGYNADYSVQGIISFGDRWKPDVGYLKNNIQALAKFTLLNASTSQTLETYAVPVTGGTIPAIQITCFLNGTIGAASSALLSVTFQDPRLVTTTINLGLPLTANGSAFYPPLTILVNPGSNVVINFVATGALTNATCGGVITQLFLF